ncbi:uncharacterized protein LOC114521061 [Dendronephthya gigantea]|uniref:uncharacterized protein LOC114521061 n=1 Tax=Dendronephthya gigantea TaxID=151771 RepID=UPI00106CB659|nr:uncharacterized protein LOC114521061 [Dendronephthya gigantea]
MSQILALYTRFCAEFPKRTVNFINVSGVLLILATISRPIIADDQHLQHGNRTCIPAAAEPLLNSSGCYPLINFTWLFCQNHGVSLSDYIYKTPLKQSRSIEYVNNLHNQYLSLGVSKISRFFNVDTSAVIKCWHAYVPCMCRIHFPLCEGTESKYKKQKLCRETWLSVTRICGKITDFVAKVSEIKNLTAMSKQFIFGELQPYRNAGDSPECWYRDFENSTVATLAPEWTTNAV